MHASKEKSWYDYVIKSPAPTSSSNSKRADTRNHRRSGLGNEWYPPSLASNPKKVEIKKKKRGGLWRSIKKLFCCCCIGGGGSGDDPHDY